jgi:hypothetical protein
LALQAYKTLNSQQPIGQSFAGRGKPGLFFEFKWHLAMGKLGKIGNISIKSDQDQRTVLFLKYRVFLVSFN